MSDDVTLQNGRAERGKRMSLWDDDRERAAEEHDQAAKERDAGRSRPPPPPPVEDREAPPSSGPAPQPADQQRGTPRIGWGTLVSHLVAVLFSIGTYAQTIGLSIVVYVVFATFGIHLDSTTAFGSMLGVAFVLVVLGRLGMRLVG